MDIGDLFMKILANDAGFQADLVAKATKAGDAAGASLGQSMGAAIKSHGMKIIGTALSAGLGLATKGMLDLQNVTADFRAETGATADEADRAEKAINAMSGRNIQPITEIGAALTKVHTDMGVIGDEAVSLTQQFLTFGRATKQETSSAVKAFDDILDAWGLTADHSADIMDKLTLSHQRYGGSIVEDQAALAAMAPQLKALNLDIDDGIGLLNLFATSGLDASAGQKALNAAITKLPKGETLTAFIARLSTIEDDGLRAQTAISVFGAKAGAGLANAIKPGVDSLDAFKVSTNDAAGATEEAAKVLDSTWGAKFQLQINKAKASIIDFGSSFGPAVTGMASLAVLVESLGGGHLVSILSKGLGKVWTKVGGSALVTKAVAFASGKAATVYLAGLIAGDAIGEALSKAWTKVASSSVVQSAGSAAGKVMGSTLGKALSIAFAAAAVVEVWDTYNRIKGELAAQGAALGTQVGDQISTGTLESLQQSRAAVLQGLNDLAGINDFGLVTGDTRKLLEQQFNDLSAAIERQTSRAGKAADDLGGGLAPAKVALTAMATTGETSFTRVSSAAARARIEIGINASRIATAVHTLTTKLVAEAQALISGYYDPIIAQDDLRVAKDEVTSNKLALAAAKVALAKTKAGSDERKAAQQTVDQSKLALDQSMSNLDQTRLTLLSTGDLSKKDQKEWLTELQKKYKTATGDARTQIGLLIAKIKELQAVPSTAVAITVGPPKKPVSGSNANPEARAGGGPVLAGHPYLVNENTPNSEWFVPEVSGFIAPRLADVGVPAAAAAGGGPSITIHNPVPHAADDDIGRMMRRLAALGIG